MAKLSFFETVTRNYFSSFEVPNFDLDLITYNFSSRTLIIGIYRYDYRFHFERLDNNLYYCIYHCDVYKNSTLLRKHTYKFFSRHIIDKHYLHYIDNVLNLE